MKSLYVVHIDMHIDDIFIYQYVINLMSLLIHVMNPDTLFQTDLTGYFTLVKGKYWQKTDRLQN